jgi:hypothetical protein
VTRWLLRSALAVGGLVALVGVAHAPPFRAVLQRAACPVGGSASATPGEREATRVRHLTLRLGDTPRPGNVVLGVALGEVTPAAARRQLQLDEAACVSNSLGMVSECRGADGATTFLRADDAGRLVALARLERSADAQRAADTGRQLAWELERSFGAPQVSRGSFEAAALGAGPLAQARREWRFTDLVLSVSATNVGEDFVVTVEAQSTPGGALSQKG